MRTLALMLVLCCFASFALAKDPESTPPPAPVLSSTDLADLDGVEQVFKSAQVDAQTAQLVMEKAQIIVDRAKVNLDRVRYKILAFHKLSPEEYDVVQREVERNGQRFTEWAIVRKEPPKSSSN